MRTTLPPRPVALPVAPSRPQAWARTAGWRLRQHFWVKLLGISGFMTLFFAGYFHLLRNPIRPVTEMSLTALDQAISLQPAWLGAYVSLWVFVGLAPGLIAGLRPLIAYGAWIGALCATGLLCFWLVPTAVPRPELPPELLQQGGFALLQGLDAAGNACPSLHVATALFTALWHRRLLAELGAPRWTQWFNAVWLLLIVYSTLATKQHVVWDVLGGVLLALLFAVPSLRAYRGSSVQEGAR